MSNTYWVRNGSDTTEVEADDHTEARELAAEQMDDPSQFTDLEPHHLDDVEEMREGDFNELFTDVHVTIDTDGEWTGSLVVETNEDSEYQRETLYELERVDELGVFGMYVHGEAHGEFEHNDVTVLVRGGVHDGEEGGSVYVVDNASDL